MNAGRVQALASREWVYLPDRSSDEFAVFQVKNPADEGTPDSANVSIRSLPRWHNIDVAMDEHLKSLLKVSTFSVVSNRLGPGGTRIIRSRGQLEQTNYAHIMMVGSQEGTVVVCEVGWPLLEETTRGWNDALLRDFKAFASSVRAGGQIVFPGPYPIASDGE